jgi:hypothetical protein
MNSWRQEAARIDSNRQSLTLFCEATGLAVT